MDLRRLEAGVARLAALLAPVAKEPVNTSDPEWPAKLAAKFGRSSDNCCWPAYGP